MTSESPIKPVAKRSLPDILQVPWGMWDGGGRGWRGFGIKMGLGGGRGVVGNDVPAAGKG